jgi:hypothetical protein
MIQQSNLWGYTQRNATQVTPEAPAHPCLLQLTPNKLCEVDWLFLVYGGPQKGQQTKF